MNKKHSFTTIHVKRLAYRVPKAFLCSKSFIIRKKTIGKIFMIIRKTSGISAHKLFKN
jgi:hypothetical protein